MRLRVTGFVVAAMTTGSMLAAGPTIWSPDNLADFNVGPGGDRVITYDAAAPAVPAVVGRTGFTGSLFSGMDFDCDGNLYGYVQTGAVGLYSIDQSTGAATFIGSGGVLSGDIITDIAFDHDANTMYGIGSFSNPNIYEIDLSSGVATNLGTVSTTGVLCTGLAIDAAGDFYGQDLISDSEFVWAGPVGAGVSIGFQGFDANFAQGTTTDRTGDDDFYHCAFNSGAFLCELWKYEGGAYGGAKTRVDVIGPFNFGTGLPEYETSDGAIRPNCGACELELTGKGDCPGDYRLRITCATPNGDVCLFRSFNRGNFTLPTGPCAGTVLDLGPRVVLVGTFQADGDGTVIIGGTLPDAACGRLMLQAVDQTTCATSNVHIVL